MRVDYLYGARDSENIDDLVETGTENEGLFSNQFETEEDYNNDFEESEKEKERKMQEILPFPLPSPPQIDLDEMVNKLLQKTRVNPRMPNEFFIFRKVIVKELKSLAATRTTNGQSKKAKMTKVSKMASDSWRVAPQSVKTEYRKLAREVERMYIDAKTKQCINNNNSGNDNTQYDNQEFENLFNLNCYYTPLSNLPVTTLSNDAIDTPTTATTNYSPFSQYDYSTLTPMTAASCDSFADDQTSPLLSMMSTNPPQQQPPTLSDIDFLPELSLLDL
ncbi:2937_t:CDS:2 [Ambispora leptoticha]|uniref:2937_t:CDS:1 n=1 Tax=Ambispora leptoticha TaxID=144679 RepID=A0A9N9AZ52_9GLOM|nr:2937_t:CDS:2 [Ambispora leptoticha]